MRYTTAALFLAVSTLAALPAAADEFTYSLTSDQCSGGCGTSPFGTVDVKAIGTGTGGAGEVQVTVTLLNGDEFVKTGSADSLDFNLTSSFANTITLSNFSTGFGTAGTQAAGSNHTGGLGDFEYFVSCTGCGSGASSPEAGPLTFDVTETGLTAAAFAQLSSGGGTSAYFAVDIIGNNGKTGPVGAVGTGTSVLSTTPEPTSIVLLGSLVGLAVLKMKNKLRARS